MGSTYYIGVFPLLGGKSFLIEQFGFSKTVATRRAASFTQDLQQRIALLPIGEIGYYFLVGAAL